MPKPKWREVFWSRVGKTVDCWIWLGSQDKDGYGRFGHGNSWSNSFAECREIRAHRISWFLTYGPIPGGKWVLHKCDNPECINPSHLFLGDNKLNCEDRTRKNRQPKRLGEDNPISPLTEIQVLQIRSRWAGGETQTALAKEFGIGQSSVSEIVHRKTWKHI